MSKFLLEISLFGACIVRSCVEKQFDISGAKHRALFVLLATAPFGRRSRTFLQDTLWGTACFDSGRQSLRRALSDIKAILGPAYVQLISTNNTDVTIDLDLVNFVSVPKDGEFLEGLNIREKLFQEWVNHIKIAPERINFAVTDDAFNQTVRAVPSITVLPFKLVFGDPRYEALGDWVAEEVSRSLSRTNLLHVISHLSSRKFVKDTIDISRVRTSLDVDYCVSGCIRLDGDAVIVDADFISTQTGQILWTRQFSGPLKKFVNSAAEGIDEIVRAIGGMLATDALRFIQDRDVHQIEDHRLLIAGVDLMHRATFVEFSKSRDLILEALNRVPRSAEIHAWLGKWYTLCVFNGWSSDIGKDTQNAVDCTARALDLNPENSFCLTIDGFTHNNLLQDLEVAEARYKQAISINPNDALGWLLTGTLHVFRNDAVQAMNASLKAKKLSPLDPFGYFYDTHIAGTHLASHDYKEALKLADKSLLVNDRHLSTLRIKISALHHLGRSQEASKAAVMLLEKQPSFRVSEYMKDHPAAKFATGKEIAEALLASGIPN